MDTVKSLEKKSGLKIISSFITSLGLIVCMITLILLSIGSILCSFLESYTDLSETGNQYIFLKNPEIMIAPIVVTVVMFVLAYILLKLKKVNWKVLLLISFCISFCVQLWWILGQHTVGTYYSDAKQLLSYAEGLSNGQKSLYFDASLPSNLTDMKQGTLYFVNYPYQLGGFSFYYLLFQLFHSSAPLAFQIINAIANSMTIVMLSFSAGTFLKNNEVKGLNVILLTLFIPNLMYSSFMYCNQIGFFLASIFIFLQSISLSTKSNKKAITYAIFSLIPYALMCWVKLTFCIIAIAYIILWIIKLCSKISLKNTFCMILCVFIFFIGNVSTTIPNTYMENQMGYFVGKGIPKTAWIAMGLQDTEREGTVSFPGWWNGFTNAIQVETNNDYEEMEKLSSKSLKDSLSYFIQNPGYMLNFFAKKLASEWFTPDFNAHYFAAINYDKNGNNDNIQFTVSSTEFPNVINTEYDRMWHVIYKLDSFMDGYQSFIYIFSLIGIIALFRKRKNLDAKYLIFPCIFILGFVLYVIWEAKAQYVMPFFMCLIPVASLGIYELFNQIHTRNNLKNFKDDESTVNV